MDILKIIHNAGFFSNCSIALQDIMIFFKREGKLPDIVDRSTQFEFYRTFPGQNLIDFYFEEDTEINIFPGNPARITKLNDIDPQFSDYRQLDFDSSEPFVSKYFDSSEPVKECVSNLIVKYNIDILNTCAVFYRGNDKITETGIGSYDEFIAKAHEIKKTNPDIKFLIQPDEIEFLEAFRMHFPDAIWIEETPAMSKKNSAIFYELPFDQRPEHGKHFFASVLIMSQCRHLITHSGNGGLWSVLYRGNSKNVHQYLTDKWL